MGGLMSLRANKRGLAGAVIDGAVRDVAELRKARWPVFATAITPRAGTHDQQGAWNTPISCAGVVVSPGDWVVADDDGVVVVPQAIWDDAMAAAQAVERKEQFIAAALLAGDSLADAFAKWNSSQN
jgi:3-hexulose-6-phosphate synthase/6-phospho-3-hexuloisomerase